MEKFDFRKIEDRERFKKLSREEQDEISDEAQDKANLMQEKNKSGEAENEDDAEQIIKFEKLPDWAKDKLKQFRERKIYKYEDFRNEYKKLTEYVDKIENKLVPNGGINFRRHGFWQELVQADKATAVEVGAKPKVWETLNIVNGKWDIFGMAKFPHSTDAYNTSILGEKAFFY